MALAFVSELSTNLTENKGYKKSGICHVERVCN